MIVTRRTAVVATVIVLGIAACDLRDSPTGDTTTASAAADPEIGSMTLAVQESGKIGVPVDVRYQVAGSPVKDQPTTLNLALVPTIAGTRMRATFIASDSLSIDVGGTELAVEQSQAAAIYRRRMMVTPRDTGNARLRVQVVMDHDGGRYVGIFTVPMSPQSSIAAGGSDEKRAR